MRCDSHNNLQDSAPCINCLSTLKILNIKRIVFSGKNNTFVSCNPNDLNTFHISTGSKHLLKISNSKNDNLNLKLKDNNPDKIDKIDKIDNYNNKNSKINNVKINKNYKHR